MIGGVLLVGSGWLLTNSPVFAARHIEISGQSHLSRSTLLRLAAVHERTNLFWFHGDVVERRLEANPWVAEATVSRSLPSTLRIEIRERKPVAQVKDGEDFLLVAADGTVLARAPQSRDLPLLVVDPTGPGLGRAAWVVGGMSPWLRARVRSVAEVAGDSVVIHLLSGVPVYYGAPTAVLQKSQALAAVIRWALTGDRPLESINLHAPLAPTARLNVYVAPVPVPVPSQGPNGSAKAGPTPSASPSVSASPSPSPSSNGGATHRATSRRTHRKG